MPRQPQIQLQSAVKGKNGKKQTLVVFDRESSPEPMRELLPQLQTPAGGPFAQGAGLEGPFRTALTQRYPFYNQREALLPKRTSPSERHYHAAHQQHCDFCRQGGEHYFGHEWHRLFDRETHKRQALMNME